MELKELKAEAYDLIFTLEITQKRLQEVNQKIAKILQEKSELKNDSTEV